MKIVPYCLITATNDELIGLTKVLDEYFPDRPRNSPSGSTTRIVERYEEEPPATVIATRLHHMGGLHAAIRTAQVLTQYNSSLIIFVGTAASMSPRKARLGDVVIPYHSYSYVYQKIVEEGQPDYEEISQDPKFEEYFLSDNALIPKLYQNDLDVETASFTAMIPDDVRLEDNGDPEPWLKELHSGRPPKIECELGIVTCGMVVNSRKFRKILEARAGHKAPIIDMESFGFFQAVNDLKAVSNPGEARVLHGIMIRGISDYAVDKNDTEGVDATWKKLAITNASRVACELIREIEAKGILVNI